MRRLLQTIVVAASMRVAVCAQTAASSNDALAQQVADEAAHVKGGTTPAQWLQAHPDEKLQMFNGPQLVNDTEHWCARTVVAHHRASVKAP